MKMRILAIAMVAVMCGVGACGGSKEKEKSSNKEITSVKVNGQPFTKNGDTFFWEYPKSDPGQWASIPPWPAPLEIVHTGVSISPSATAITLNPETGAEVTFTVKAEDDSEKPFKIRATREIKDF